MLNILQGEVPCQTDPDLWFSESPKKIELAKTICDGCWFKDECKDLASLKPEVHGVWGGKDFNLPEEREQPKLLYCRNKKHVLEKRGSCPKCRAESQARYDKKVKRWKNKPKSKPRKNVEGGYCINGHLLSGKNITIRSSDKSIMCKKCIAGHKMPKGQTFYGGMK